MNALERLFLLEVDFHRKLRTQALGKAMIGGLRTSYALQCGSMRGSSAMLARSLSGTSRRSVSD